MPSPPTNMCFFCFKIYNSCWEKHGKNSENSKENVFKKLPKNWKLKSSIFEIIINLSNVLKTLK